MQEMNKKSQIQQLLEKLKRESSKSQSPYFHLLRWKGLDLALSEIDNKNEDSSWSLQCANCSKHVSYFRIFSSLPNSNGPIVLFSNMA